MQNIGDHHLFNEVLRFLSKLATVVLKQTDENKQCLCLLSMVYMSLTNKAMMEPDRIAKATQ